MNVKSQLEEHADTIDAAIFTGDGFHDPEARAWLRSLMERWERGLKEAADISPDLEPLPNYGDLMTLAEFTENVCQGLFIPYDGSGCLATVEGMSREHSVWDLDARPDWATHVMWFNK